MHLLKKLGLSEFSEISSLDCWDPVAAFSPESPTTIWSSATGNHPQIHGPRQHRRRHVAIVALTLEKEGKK